MISVTDSAAQKILEIREQQSVEAAGLRVAVANGGCSGYVYNVEFDNAGLQDWSGIVNGVRIIVDPESAPHLLGAELDYDGGLTGQGFKFNNPNAKRGCGCGKSFS